MSLKIKKAMDKELIILEQIQNNPHVNQRDLASIAHASLGMTNAILKRFAEKGLITIKKVNNRNIRYALTSQGMEEITSRSWGYFKRTIKNVVVYQDAIREIVTQAKANGYETIVLCGQSDMAFIIEFACHKIGVSYHIDEFRETVFDTKSFFFLAETQSFELEDVYKENVFSLNRLLLNV